MFFKKDNMESNQTNNTPVEDNAPDELTIVETKIGEHIKKRRRRSSSGSKKKKHRSTHKKNGKKKMKLWKKLLIALGCIILSLALIVTGTFFYLRGTGKHQLLQSSYTISAPDKPDIKLDDGGNTVKYKGKTYKYKNNAINLLFMGIDKEDSGAKQTDIGNGNSSDVIIVMSIDSENKTVTLVNVPRDIITDISVYSKSGGYTGVEKLPIALSYAYGETEKQSCINCLESVRRIFYNVPVNAYYSLEMSGIPVINDMIDGVDVVSPEDVYAGDELYFENGKQYHLMGDDSTKFVRLRNRTTADANLLRNERQKIYLTEFMKKTINLSKSDISTPVKLYNAAADYSCTNFTINGVTYLATELMRNGGVTTKTVSIPVDVKEANNRAENYIREDEFYELFLSVFYNEV